MSLQGQRFLAFVVATAALGLVVAVLGGRLLDAAAGPEAELVTRLKHLERRGLELPLDGGVLRSQRLQYQRLSVQLDADGQGATVTGTLDFTGALVRAGAAAPTTVSSLGLERARYRYAEGEWRPETSDAPRLAALCEALEARRLRLEAAAVPGDAGLALAAISGRAWRSLAWYLRSEREVVVVSEDYRLTGDAPERPIDERGTRRLELVEAGAGGFGFSDESR